MSALSFLVRRHLERRGVPRDLIGRVAEMKGASEDFWIFLLRFLLEHGLPALIQFLQNLLEDRESK